MTLLTPDHSEVLMALADLKMLLGKCRVFIKRVELFGSTMSEHAETAQDVDIFVSYDGIDFIDLIKILGNAGLERKLVVQQVEMGYSNHPDWPAEKPIPLHLLLYHDGRTVFPPKLARTHQSAVDITREMLEDSS